MRPTLCKAYPLGPSSRPRSSFQLTFACPTPSRIKLPQKEPKNTTKSTHSIRLKVSVGHISSNKWKPTFSILPIRPQLERRNRNLPGIEPFSMQLSWCAFARRVCLYVHLRISKYFCPSFLFRPCIQRTAGGLFSWPMELVAFLKTKSLRVVCI